MAKNVGCRAIVAFTGDLKKACEWREMPVFIARPAHDAARDGHADLTYCHAARLKKSQPSLTGYA